ncbi:MAG: hypothetical protein JXA90_07195, partial [Planctomycetes bacterium]|nr:hypothetical protein [Planctomycetota bacterium]
RSGKELTLLLSDLHLGEIQLALEGFLQPKSPPSSADDELAFAISGPDLKGAFSSSGYLAVCSPAPERLEVDSVAGATEVALGEGETPPIEGAAVARLFAMPTPQARIELRSIPQGGALEFRGACLVKVLENATTLTGVYSVRVIHGQLYHLEILLPAPWRLASVRTGAEPKEAAPAFRHETVEDSGERRLRIELERRVAAGSSIELRVELEEPESLLVRDPAQRARTLAFRVPVLLTTDQARVERSQVDLGISLAPSIDATLVEQSGWQVLSLEELGGLGLKDEQIVAGLTSTAPEGEVRLDLLSRLPRGEYQAVTHVMALESHRARVRADLRLAVVDHAVESIRLSLPVGAEIEPKVLGEGVQGIGEAEPLEGGRSVRTVHFDRPWLGMRQIRIEYEQDLVEEEAAAASRKTIRSLPLAVPTIEVQGDFDGEESVALQSQGTVELVVEAGDRLLPMSIDELPEFAEAWKEGRLISAYRIRRGEATGTFRTSIHSTEPVLPSMARELKLSTVLDQSGVSWTRGEMLLAYSMLQYLRIRLPADAWLIEVEVEGEVLRSVKKEDEPGLWSIPLPPRSYASVSFVYARPLAAGGEADATGPSRRHLSSSWGGWLETGPRFLGVVKDSSSSETRDVEVPVGSTRWDLYHPPGYRFFVSGSNLAPEHPEHEERAAHFAGAFFGRLLTGRLPLISVLADEQPVRPWVRQGLGKPETWAVEEARAERQTTQGALPVQQAASSVERPPSRSLTRNLVEGYRIASAKIGGEPWIELSYRSYRWWRFSTLAVFSATLVAGLALALQGGRRVFYRAVGYGLLYLTLIPPLVVWALGWESPFLLIPVAEGAVALLLCALGVEAARALTCWLRGCIDRRRRTAAVAAVLLLALLAPSAIAEEPQRAPIRPFDDTVLIPYDPDRLFTGDDPLRKVYLPYQKFRELWLRAHPEERPEADPPADLVVGTARYDLRVSGEAYRITGEISLQVLVDEWVVVPLPFERTQISDIALDDHPVGVSQRDSVPFITVKGKGVHTLQLGLSGSIIRQPGLFQVLLGLVAGRATSVRAELPAGAEPLPGDVKNLVVEKAPEMTAVSADLGEAARFDVRWHFPGVEGQSASQIESLSYSELELVLDGYRVSRREKLTVKGLEVDAVTYRVLGGWSLRHVAAPELSQWSLVEKDGQTLLEVFFVRPVREIELAIDGWAPLDSEARPVASLGLGGASRQESYFGLRHGARRKWAASALGSLPRADEAMLTAVFAVREPPYLIHHTYGSAEGERVSAEPVSGEVDLSTELIAVLQPQQIFLTGRTRYEVKTLGPFRQQVMLPAGWKVRRVEGTALRHWEVEDAADRTLLTVHLQRRAVTGDRVQWSAELPHDAAAGSLSIPSVVTTTA